MKSQRTALLLAALCSLAWSSVAAAETCTVSGTYRNQPVDMYYCDSDRMNIGNVTCSGWLQQNLDVATLPVRYMRVRLLTTAGTPLVTTPAIVHTNASGVFSATFSSTALPSGVCRSSQVQVVNDFIRVDERDLAAGTPRYRFKIINRTDVQRSQTRTLTFPAAGTTRNADFTQNRAAADSLAHYYAVYQTMDSAVAEVVNWSTNLRDSLTSATSSQQQPVVMDINWDSLPTTEATPSSFGKIWMAWSWYRAGGVLRHELGHWVHQLMHRKNQARGGCLDGSYPGGQPQSHGVSTCEYGYFAMNEGFATLIGVRSITSNDTNVWMCNATGGAADACSLDVANRVNDADGDGVNSEYQIIGDSWADRQSRCAVLDATTCGCGAACASQAQRDSKGFRVETQTARFIWDLVDTNNEGGLDDVDRAMGDIVAALEGMACNVNTLGGDGTCNEATLTGGACSKDKYNIYDLAAILPSNETAERTLNCVAQAPD